MAGRGWCWARLGRRSGSPAMTGSWRRRRLAPRVTGGHQGAGTGLAGLPPEAAERARWWEAHIIEVVDGIRPDAPAGTSPRPAYDVERTSLRQRELAKAAELSV